MRVEQLLMEGKVSRQCGLLSCPVGYELREYEPTLSGCLVLQHSHDGIEVPRYSCSGVNLTHRLHIARFLVRPSKLPIRARDCKVGLSVGYEFSNRVRGYYCTRRHLSSKCDVDRVAGGVEFDQ